MANEITVGTGVFYTGDMANNEWFGIIGDIRDNGFSKQAYVIADYDDGTSGLEIIELNNITDRYDGHCGNRFVTEQAYLEWALRDIRAA